MNPGCRRYREILLICFAGAMLLCAQSARSQIFHAVPSGQDAAKAAADEEKETKESKMKDKKDRFTYGKRHETSVTTESTSTIQKTKHGTSDATVPTGVFKESFLDVGLSSGQAAAPSPAPSPARSPTPKAWVNPIRSSTTTALPSVSPQPSPSPAATAPAALTSPANIDITLGVSPAPNATATPKSH